MTRLGGPARVPIVAHQTAAGWELVAAVAAGGRGACSFAMLVQTSPQGLHRATMAAVAHRRLDPRFRVSARIY